MDSRSRPEAREGLRKASLDQLPHVLRTAETNLQLGRVHVDIDRIGRNLDENGARRVFPRLEKIAVGVHDGLRQHHVPDVAAVDIEEHAPRRGAGEIGLGHEPRKAHSRAGPLDGHQVIAQVAAEQQDDPVAEDLRPRHLEQRPLPRRDLRPHAPVGQQHADDDVEAVALLRGVLPQERPAHGQRIEDAAHGDRRSLGAADGFDGQDFAVLHHDARPLHIAAPPRGHFHARDRRDARQRLAPEPEGPDAVEILHGQDFACRVPLEGYGDILRTDAGTVVGDPDRLLAAAPQVDRDVRGARVDGVLQQLLHDGRGPLDDLAGGDLRCNLLGKHGDPSAQFHPSHSV